MDEYKESLQAYHLKWFDVVMAEHASLRQESAEALKHQQAIINYGLAAIGVLIAFSANLWGNEQIVESIYVLFIPFLCNLILLIWNGEVRRMTRAGKYIQRLETKVNREFSRKFPMKETALEWETYLRQPKEPSSVPVKKSFLNSLFSPEKANNKIKSNYIAIIMMFGGMSTLSIVLGIFHNYSMFSGGAEISPELLLQWASVSAVWIAAYVLIFTVDFMCFVYHYRYFKRVKN